MKRIVIKIGSSTITGGSGPPSATYLAELGGQIAAQRKLGRSVIVVSSGAIAAGMHRLGLAGKPRTIPQKQAAAAVGQGLLMQAYSDAFAAHGLTVAQVLLTRDDLSDRARYVNASNTLSALLNAGVVPIVNENDTIAVDEIKVGDNDTLAALVGALAQADAVLLLSDVEGLYDNNPLTNPDAKLITRVERIDRNIERLAGGAGSMVGTGGMRTKLAAAKICVRSGITMIIANGQRPGVVGDAIGGRAGTRFVPSSDKPLPSRKRWIAFGVTPKGTVSVNDGAFSHVADGGKSLLAAGITAVDGDFERGDLVNIADPTGKIFAQGMSNFASTEVERIMGMRSDDIAALIGGKSPSAVVHRDNLVLVD